MVTSKTEWKNVQLEDLCHFSQSGMKVISSFRPNIMSIGKGEVFDEFVNIWSFLIESVTLKRSKIHHISGTLMQVFPALMLQKVSKNSSENHEALNNRLKHWINGNFTSLISESLQIQSKLSKSRSKNARRPKSIKEIAQFVTAIEDGDIRKSANIIDPENLGLHQWSEKVTNDLVSKFPKCDYVAQPKETKQSCFRSTNIQNSTVLRAINSSPSKAGGINHIGYDTFRN